MAKAMTMTQLLREVERLRARLAESEAAPAEDQDEPAGHTGRQDRYRELFESSRDAITVTTRHGDIVDVNPAALELFGWTREEMRSLNFGQLYADRSDGQRFVAEIEQNGSVRDFEVKLRGQGGREMDCLVTATVRRGRDGSISGYQGIIRDISQQKRALERLRESETRYRTLFETANDAIFLMQKGLFVDCNGRTLEMFGCAKDQIIGQTPARFSPERQADGRSSGEKAREKMAAAQTGRPQFFEWRHSSLDGREFDAEVSLNLITLSGQSFLLAVVRDITARKRAENALKESEERHRTVLEASPDPVAVYNSAWEMTYVNPAFSEVFGWALEECLEQNIDFVPQEYLSDMKAALGAIVKGGTISGIESRRWTKDRRLIDVSISTAAFFDGQANLQGSVVTFQDITERKRTEEQLKFIAYHDPLTGLPNRKSFYEHLEDRLTRSRRQPTSRWALLFLDLDRFKDVNDTLGHDVGDELLKAASRRIQSCLRKTDYMFRLGGDEFTILATNLTKDIHAANVAERILKSVARPFHIFGHEVYITGSIGISVHPEDGDSVEGLVKNADLAMYVAKEDANNYRFYAQEMNERALERLSLDSSLRQAAQRDQLIVYYQPLVDQERRIVGLEALLRWRHPELGLIHPDRFIPLAEETGAIIGIGEWVLNTACRQIQKWRREGHEELYVAVNLSARQFKQPDLVNTVKRVLEETGLPPECLQLELTETSVMANPEEAVAKMKELHREGIRFSIDDFGTGYSSLNYLKRFPVDTLKIDRSFIREATSNPEDQEIIRAIISMARNLSMEPLAEGVESREQQEFLADHGCDMMQGFFFGRPMPGEEIDRLLRRMRV